MKNTNRLQRIQHYKVHIVWNTKHFNVQKNMTKNTKHYIVQSIVKNTEYYKVHKNTNYTNHDKVHEKHYKNAKTLQRILTSPKYLEQVYSKKMTKCATTLKCLHDIQNQTILNA